MSDETPAPFKVSIPRGRVGEFAKMVNRIETWAWRNRFIVAIPEGKSFSALYFTKERAAKSFKKTFLAA